MPQAPPAPSQSSPGLLSQQADARETREELHRILEQYPPSVREVLRIDPTLMYRPDYVANYPVLAAFLEQHPEIAHNPGFFVGEWRSREENNPRMESVRAIRDFSHFLGITFIVMTITAGIVFLVKTVVEHWRWQRAMKAQSELNTKLIDRFATSDALLAYLQSPQGKALTDSPVLAQPAASRMIDAPLSRIFWSLQAGAVLAFAGAGLLVVSNRTNGEFIDVAPAFFAFGIVVLATGLGFLASSAISYLLSQRLGLVRSLPRVSGEAPGS